MKYFDVKEIVKFQGKVMREEEFACTWNDIEEFILDNCIDRYNETFEEHIDNIDTNVFFDNAVFDEEKYDGKFYKKTDFLNIRNRDFYNGKNWHIVIENAEDYYYLKYKICGFFLGMYENEMKILKEED